MIIANYFSYLMIYLYLHLNNIYQLIGFCIRVFLLQHLYHPFLLILIFPFLLMISFSFYLFIILHHHPIIHHLIHHHILSPLRVGFQDNIKDCKVRFHQLRLLLIRNRYLSFIFA